MALIIPGLMVEDRDLIHGPCSLLSSGPGLALLGLVSLSTPLLRGAPGHDEKRED